MSVVSRYGIDCTRACDRTGKQSQQTLSGLGVSLSRYLSEWEGDRIAVCVRSVTDLLERAGLERVFRLLHVLIHHIESTGAMAHYHMDPGAHDQHTVNVLETLFDAAVGLDEDGEWTVSKR